MTNETKAAGFRAGVKAAAETVDEMIALYDAEGHIDKAMACRKAAIRIRALAIGESLVRGKEGSAQP